MGEADETGDFEIRNSGQARSILLPGRLGSLARVIEDRKAQPVGEVANGLQRPGR